MHARALTLAVFQDPLSEAVHCLAAAKLHG
jgi:hypothetical protein